MERWAGQVVVSGWYGYGNVGDEAILVGILEGLRRELPGWEVVVLSGDPRATKRQHGVRAAPQVLGTGVGWGRMLLTGRVPRALSAVADADLFLLGGGGFLSDWQPEAPAVWLRQLPVARLLGARTMVFGVGAGPFFTREGQRTVRRLARWAHAITVRDAASRTWLLRAGVEREVVVAADPAWGIAAAPDEEVTALCRSEGLPAALGDAVGVNAIPLFARGPWDRPAERLARLRQALRKLVEEIAGSGRPALLIPFQESERRFWEEIFPEGLPSPRVHLLQRVHPPQAILGLLGRLSLVIGMRLHALLLAAHAGTPVVGIVYHPKGEELLAELGQGDCAARVGDGRLMDDSDLDPAEALRLVEKVWGERDRRAAAIATRARLLRTRERRSWEVLRGVIEEEKREG